MPRREIEVRVIGEPDPKRVAELIVRIGLRGLGIDQAATTAAPTATPAASLTKKRRPV